MKCLGGVLILILSASACSTARPGPILKDYGWVCINPINHSRLDEDGASPRFIPIATSTAIDNSQSSQTAPMNMNPEPMTTLGVNKKQELEHDEKSYADAGFSKTNPLGVCRSMRVGEPYILHGVRGWEYGKYFAFPDLP